MTTSLSASRATAAAAGPASAKPPPAPAGGGGEESAPTEGAGADPTKPPGDEAFVRWMARNCPSNAELATLSNVCGRWRRVVADVLADDLLRPYSNHLAAAGTNIGDETIAGKHGANNSDGANGAKDKVGRDKKGIDKACTRSDLARLYPVASLLLPEMAMELIERRRVSLTRKTAMENESAGYSSEEGEVLVPITGGEDGDVKPAKDDDNDDDHDEHMPAINAAIDGEGQFCLAWFAPSGIQIQSVRVGDGGDDQSVSSSSSEGMPDTDAASSRMSSATPPFGPSGQETYDMSETEEVAADKDKARRRGYLSGKDSGGPGGGGGARGPSPAPDPNSPHQRRRPPMNRTVATGAAAAVKKKKSTDDASGRLQTCALGWSSYLSAMDVLLPFGYSTSFVRVRFWLLITYLLLLWGPALPFVTRIQSITVQPSFLSLIVSRASWTMPLNCPLCIGALAKSAHATTAMPVCQKVALLIT